MNKLTFFFLLFVAFLANTANSQWVQSGLATGYIKSFGTAGNDLLACGAGTGISRSTDGGMTWTDANTGFDYNNGAAVTHIGSTLFAANPAIGIYISTDNAKTWSHLSGATISAVGSLAVIGTNVFTGSLGFGIYRSADTGKTWMTVNNGVTSTDIICMTTNGPSLFAGSIGVFRSTNNGDSWISPGTGMPLNPIQAMVNTGTYLYAGLFDAGVFRSSDDGATWTSVKSGLPKASMQAFYAVGNNVLVGTDDGRVFVTSNNGTSWVSVTGTGLPNKGIRAFTVSGTNLLAGTDSGVWRRSIAGLLGVTRDPSAQISSLPVLEQNYPNPFLGKTIIPFSIPYGAEVTLKIYDQLGKEIAVLANTHLGEGKYHVDLDATAMAAGMYYARLQAGEFLQTRGLLVKK